MVQLHKVFFGVTPIRKVSKMKLYEILQSLALLTPIAGTIWWLAEIKSQIYQNISASLLDRDKRINELETKIVIQLEIYDERKEFVDYQLHGLNEKLNHKFQRCMDEIKTIREEKQ